MVIGGGAFALGGLWLAVLADDQRDIALVWMPAAVLLGFGAAIAWPAIFGSVMVAIPQDRYAAATGMNQTVQRIAGAVGVALAVTLLGTTTTPDAALFRRLFVMTTVCGVISVAIGMQLRSIPKGRHETIVPGTAPASAHVEVEGAEA